MLPQALAEIIRSRRFRRAAILACAGIIVWLVVSYLIAAHLTHRRRPPFAEPPPRIGAREFESHRLRTRDRQEIGAWFLRGNDDLPSVLLLHGNGGSRGNCLERSTMFAAEGFSVMLISLRAHGDSTGEFNDIGYSARLDVEAAVEFLEQHRPVKPVVIHGTSMGSAAALFASKGLANRIHGYILECPYRDLTTAVWNRTENALPPVLDWIAFQGLLLVSPLVLPDLDRISPVSAIDGVPRKVPVLILAGGGDRRARPEEARALFDRVRSHGALVMFEGADHMQLHRRDPERYKAALLDFLWNVAHRDSPDGRDQERPAER